MHLDALQALSANTTFLDEQLASLSENASSLRQRLLSQDVQLQSFLQLIDSGTQQLLDSYRAKQEAASQTNTDILSSVEGGCSQVLAEADESYLALNNSVSCLTQAVEAVLSAQEQYIRERREKEQKSLMNEVGSSRGKRQPLQCIDFAPYIFRTHTYGLRTMLSQRWSRRGAIMRRNGKAS